MIPHDGLAFSRGRWILLLSLACLAVLVVPASSCDGETPQPERSEEGTISATGGAATTAPEPLTPEPLPPELPSTFSLTLQHGPTADNVFVVHASGAATFRRDPRLGAASAELRLTDEELRSVYRRLRQMEFFRYPASFDPPPRSDEGGMVDGFPANTFVLTVAGVGPEHTVRLTDGACSDDPAAVAFRELVDHLLEVLHAKPEIEALPPATSGYL